MWVAQCGGHVFPFPTGVTMLGATASFRGTLRSGPSGLNVEGAFLSDNHDATLLFQARVCRAGKMLCCEEPAHKYSSVSRRYVSHPLLHLVGAGVGRPFHVRVAAKGARRTRQQTCSAHPRAEIAGVPSSSGPSTPPSPLSPAEGFTVAAALRPPTERRALVASDARPSEPALAPFAHAPASQGLPGGALMLGLILSGAIGGACRRHGGIVFNL